MVLQIATNLNYLSLFRYSQGPKGSNITSPYSNTSRTSNPRGVSSVEAPMPFQAATNPRARGVSTVEAPMPFQAAPNPRLRTSSVEAPMPFQAAPNLRLAKVQDVQITDVIEEEEDRGIIQRTDLFIAHSWTLFTIYNCFENLLKHTLVTSPSTFSDKVRMPTTQPIYESTIDDSAFDVGPDQVLRRG